MAGATPRRSLRTRLLAAALVLVLAALVVAGLAIGVILHRFVRGQLDGRLDAQITALRAGLEWRVLSCLMLNRETVVPRLHLIERVYEGDADVDSNSVEVIITRLRRKIAPARIESVRGHGYRLHADPA